MKTTLKTIMDYSIAKGIDTNKILDAWNENPTKLIREYKEEQHKPVPELTQERMTELMDKLDMDFEGDFGKRLEQEDKIRKENFRKAKQVRRTPKQLPPGFKKRLDDIMQGFDMHIDHKIKHEDDDDEYGFKGNIEVAIDSEYWPQAIVSKIVFSTKTSHDIVDQVTYEVACAIIVKGLNRITGNEDNNNNKNK